MSNARAFCPGCGVVILVAAVLLLGEQATAATRERVLVSQPRSAGDIAPDTLTVVGELLTQVLADDPRYDVLAASEASDIARAAADEGCTDKDCLLEIAGAMGVDHVVMSMLSASGAGFRLELGWLVVSTMHLRKTFRIEVRSVEELPSRLRPAVAQLSRPDPLAHPDGQTGAPVARLATVPRTAPTVEDPAAAAWPSWYAIGGLGSGAVALAVASTTLLVSLALRESVASATTPRDTKDKILIAGPLVVIGGGCGSCLLLGAGAMLGVMALLE